MVSVEEARKMEVAELVEDVEKHGVLNVEAAALAKLRAAQNGMREIDLGFMRQVMLVKHNGVKWPVPRFAVQGRINGGFSDCAVLYIGHGLSNRSVGVHLWSGGTLFTSMAKPFIAGLMQGDFGWDNPRRLGHDAVEFTVGKPWRRVLRRKQISASASYVGIIPNPVKEKLIQADKTFGQNVYLVWETQPQNWSFEEVERPLVADPLIIGLMGNRAYLVAQFDSTPIERYVSAEFTSAGKEMR